MHTANEITLRRWFSQLGPEPHRIDWFGNVTNVGANGGYMPRVALVVSPFRPDEPPADENERAAPARKIVVPIAFLRMLRMGDIWSGGEKVGSDPSSLKRRIERLEITRESVTIAPAGVPLPSADGTTCYPLPFPEFSSLRGHTHANCARIAAGKDLTLIVPCMELVRFYFGASGKLLSQLFSGALGADRLYRNARLHPESRTAHVDLWPGIPGVAACTIGRIALDPNARHAMRWIVNSGMSSAAKGAPYYPRTTFPFSGVTDLVFTGRWARRDSPHVFLVERLLQCTYPFPFDKLFYTSSAPKAARVENTSNRPEDPGDAPEPCSPGAESTPAQDLTEAPVARDLPPLGIEIPDEGMEPFPDLSAKMVRRVKENEPSFRRSSKSNADVVLGTGESLTNGEARAVEIGVSFGDHEVEEIFPDVVDVMQAAFAKMPRGDDGRSGRSWRVEPPKLSLLPVDEFTGEGGEVFQRVDALVNQQDDRLANLWAARISVLWAATESSLLVVVRDGVVREVRDHVVLLRYDSGRDEQGQLLRDMFLAVAGMRPIETLSDALVGYLDSARAGRVEDIIEFMLGARDGSSTRNTREEIASGRDALFVDDPLLDDLIPDLDDASERLGALSEWRRKTLAVPDNDYD